MLSDGPRVEVGGNTATFKMTLLSTSFRVRPVGSAIGYFLLRLPLCLFFLGVDAKVSLSTCGVRHTSNSFLASIY